MKHFELIDVFVVELMGKLMDGKKSLLKDCRRLREEGEEEEGRREGRDEKRREEKRMGWEKVEGHHIRLT